jgi:DNA polymerase III subunit delta
MKIYSNKLDENLRAGLNGCYIFASNEPFWLTNASERVLEQAYAKGFTPENKYSFSDDNLNLDALQEACSSPGLFANKVVVTLNIKNLKGRAAEALKLVKELLNSSLLLIITMPQISQTDLRNSLLAPLEKVAIVVIFYPLSDNEMMNFIVEQAKKYQISFQRDGISLLYRTYEGNLFALVQAIQKLNLCGYTGVVNTDILKNNIDSDNHFSTYDLVEGFVDANNTAQKRLRMLESLKNEGVSITDILSKIGQALTSLYELRSLIDNNQNIETWFEKHPLLKLLKSKRSIYSQGANSISSESISHLLNLLCQADILARSFDEESAFLILREIAVSRSFPNVCKLTEND